MPALNRAKALAEVNGIFSIGEDLELHVLRTFDELLDKDTIVAECRLGTRLAQIQSGFKLACLMYNLHPNSTTSCRGLDYHRVSNLIGQLACDLRIIDGLVTAFCYG